jgi:hypothetical protein
VPALLFARPPVDAAEERTVRKQAGARHAPGWTPEGHRVKARLVYGGGPEKTWVYGALRVGDGQAVTMTAPSRNSVGYQRLLATVEAANPLPGWPTIPVASTPSSPPAPAGRTSRKAGGASSVAPPSPGSASPPPRKSRWPPGSRPGSSTLVPARGSGPPTTVPRHDGASSPTAIEERSTRVSPRGQDPRCLHRRDPHALVEEAAIRRAMLLAERAGSLPLHLAHGRRKRRARARRGTRPRSAVLRRDHHPSCRSPSASSDDERQGLLRNDYPTSKYQQDQDLRWQALADGRLQAVGSDHFATGVADHDDKLGTTVDRMLAGRASVELSLPVAFRLGVQQGRMSVDRIVEAVATESAGSMGLDPQRARSRPAATPTSWFWTPTARGPSTTSASPAGRPGTVSSAQLPADVLRQVSSDLRVSSGLPARRRAPRAWWGRSRACRGGAGPAGPPRAGRATAGPRTSSRRRPCR